MSAPSLQRSGDATRRRAHSRGRHGHAGAPANVSVTLLDGFSASVGGIPVDPGAWRLKKARELVKLLALAPRHRLHREQAMDVLWGDRAPAAAANNLHQAVHVARRALDPHAIEVQDEMLQLVADVDVDRLEAAAAEARRARTPEGYRAALLVYRGELLPENRYDDWVETRREELAELADALAEELAAIDPCEPLRTPSLPAAASSFIGRESEMTELKALVARTRVLTLAGIGGVGKTRLALELARTLEPSYTSGAVLVELAAVNQSRLIPDAIAAALDVHALSEESALEAIADHLAPRSLLLVLDNCEHLLGAAGEVVDMLLRRAPAVTVLATSREPLRVPGEIVFRVPSLDIPDPDRLRDAAELLDYEAVRLFVERAHDASLDFTLDEHNVADVARICFRLDGLPLALELAAGRMGALGPAAIAGRLDDRFRVLHTTSRVAPTRQHTLSATLRWSHDLLEPDEQTLFRRLAIFVGGFDLEAAERVCADAAVGGDDVADVLARLVEKSLVAVDDASSRERRYRLLETVRMYALDRLGEAGECAALAERHAAWALALAELHRGSKRLDRDAANLRKAVDRLLRTSPADALRLAVAMLPFWMRRIDLQEAQERLDACLAAAPARHTLRCEVRLAAAAIEMRSGRVARGLAHAEDASTLAKEIGDARIEWRALQCCGEFGLVADAPDAAMSWLQRALEVARRERFAAAEATGVYSLGVAHWMFGDLDQAESLVAQSIERFGALTGSPERISSLISLAETSRPAGRTGLRIVFEDTFQPFVEISCDAAVAYALAAQAGIARARGDLRRARVLLDESAARFEDLGDETGQAAVLVRHAYLDLAEGALPAAREAVMRALLLRRAKDDRRGSGIALAALGAIDTAGGDYRNAERHLADAREIFHCAGDRWGLASTLWKIADLAFERGRFDDAAAALQEARAVLGPTRRDRWMANTLVGLADVALLRGYPHQAAALLADARDRYTARHDAAGVADIEERLRHVAKASLSPFKDPPGTTHSSSTTKGRRR